MVSRKCLATLRRPSTAPTFRAISASPRSGLRARVVATWIFARSFSDATSRSSRLRARSAARSRFRQTTSRSPGKSGELISAMFRSSKRESCNGPPSAASAWMAGARSAVIGGLQLFFDPGTGDHAAVADQHHPLQTEASLQLVDLRGERLRIGGVALEHLDRHRAAVGGAQQPKDDLRPVGTAIATVAPLPQLAAAALEIAGGDVIEHQRAVLQMPPRQRLLDRWLRRAQQ